MSRRERLLRIAFLVGALTDGAAVLPLAIPRLATLMWGLKGSGGSYVLVAGYAAVLMLGWTVLLLWARTSPIERAFVAELTFLVIVGLVIAEIAAVEAGGLLAGRMIPTWSLQAILLVLFAVAYRYPEHAR